jgi:hypothetical protein
VPPRPAWPARLLGISAFLGFYPERLGTLALRMPRFVREARAYRRAEGGADLSAFAQSKYSCGLFEFTKD